MAMWWTGIALVWLMAGFQIPLGMERASAARIVSGSPTFIEIGYVLRAPADVQIKSMSGTVAQTYRIHHTVDQWERAQILWHVWNAPNDPGAGPFPDYNALSTALGGASEVARGIHKIETNLKRSASETMPVSFMLLEPLTIAAGRYLVLGCSRTQNAPANSNTFGIYNFEIQLVMNTTGPLQRIR